MYSPKISKEYIPKLYRLAKYFGVPMTKLVNQIISEYFKKLDKVLDDIAKGKNNEKTNPKPLAESIRNSEMSF